MKDTRMRIKTKEIIKKVINEPPALIPATIKLTILTIISSIALHTKYMVLFLVLLSTFSVHAELHIKTLNDWVISDFSESSLLVAKGNDLPREHKAVLGFELQRPYCVAMAPIIMIPSKAQKFSDGDEVYAEMVVDKNKAHTLLLKKEFGFDDDKEGYETNWFSLQRFPSFSDAERIVVRFNSRTPLDDVEFTTTGIREASYQAEKICDSDMTIKQVNSMEKV